MGRKRHTPEQIITDSCRSGSTGEPPEAHAATSQSNCRWRSWGGAPWIQADHNGGAPGKKSIWAIRRNSLSRIGSRREGRTHSRLHGKRSPLPAHEPTRRRATGPGPDIVVRAAGGSRVFLWWVHYRSGSHRRCRGSCLLEQL